MYILIIRSNVQFVNIQLSDCNQILQAIKKIDKPKNIKEAKEQLGPCEEKLKLIVLSIINKYLSNYKNITEARTNMQKKFQGREKVLSDMRDKINNKVENVNIQEFVKLLEKVKS